MGNQVRKEAENRGVDNDSESLSRLMLELRKERGNNAIANMCIDKINEITNENIIIDGIRNIEEIELFTKIGDVKIVLISNCFNIRKMCRNFYCSRVTYFILNKSA